MLDERVLVVGTTTDYIDLIGRRFPGRALFLTAAEERARPSHYHPPDKATEVLCDLSRPDRTVNTLNDHLKRCRIKLSGITCFDCESLDLAAFLAQAFSLPFSSPAAVNVSRNKYFSKCLWKKAGLPCPEAQLVRRPSDAIRFIRASGRPVVLKPLTGSGSELVFLCRDDEDCLHAFHSLLSKLGTSRNRRMYEDQFQRLERSEHRAFVVEEMLEGEEYSCDFTLDDKGLEIIRISKKISARNQTFGTVMAYILPGELPPDIDLNAFRIQARDAARALGLRRAICMLDFVVMSGEARMIEMTPRPGGDCLPSLERLSSGFDMLGYALDFAEGKKSAVPPSGIWQRLVGLHLLAKEPGIVRAIDIQNLRSDPRVLESHLTTGSGHRVIMPPEDYGSRRLGYAIFKPSTAEKAEEECLDLLDKVTVEMETV